jgi:microcystin-dependent protein
MATHVYFTPGTLPEDYCFTTPQQFYNDIINNLIGEIPGNYNSFNFGNDVPDAADQDKPWIRTDAYGNFDRIYTFYGAWVSPHPTPPSSCERRLWVCAEADVWAYDGGDGTDPGSSPPTATTGAMWEVDHDFDARVPLGPGTLPMCSEVVGVGDTGGEDQHLLTWDEAKPEPHTHKLTVEDSDVTDVVDPGELRAGSGVEIHWMSAIVDGDEVAITRENAITDNSYGDQANEPHNNMPPYIGVFFIKRTARVYYTV